MKKPKKIKFEIKKGSSTWICIDKGYDDAFSEMINDKFSKEDVLEYQNAIKQIKESAKNLKISAKNLKNAFEKTSKVKIDWKNNDSSTWCCFSANTINKIKDESKITEFANRKAEHKKAVEALKTISKKISNKCKENTKAETTD